MSKNILFYIPTINQHAGGVRQYSFNILKVISENYSDDYNFYVYHKRKDKLFLDIIDQTKNFHLVPRYFVMKTIIKTVNLFLKPFKKKIEFVDFLVRTLDIEIVHSPYQFIPKTTKAKLICTMHDVQELHFPEFFSAAELESRAINYTDFIKRADAIVVSFNHVKHDIVRFFKTKEEKIYTILVGINSLWIVDYFNSKRKISCETKFEIFLLYPANSWKHKNHLGLLEALKILKEQQKIVNLILTGDFSNDHGQFLVDKINEYDLSNQVELKGIVSQEELYSFYMKSRAVVVPTLYEAGSYPLYEALCIEKAVICSNVTSLPETIGNDKFVFNPNDYSDIADKMSRIYFNDIFRTESSENAVKMKNKLQNNDAIAVLYQIYQTI
jgi:glycosyltransferase involved in cell wall biosynthesis